MKSLTRIDVVGAELGVSIYPFQISPQLGLEISSMSDILNAYNVTVSSYRAGTDGQIPNLYTFKERHHMLMTKIALTYSHYLVHNAGNNKNYTAMYLLVNSH